MLETELPKTKDKILIVEDEETIRDMLGYALMKEGYDCTEANDVDEAKNNLQNAKPNLILLDWMLPGMSGIDYAKRLRTVPETRDIPIIMLTAKSEESDKVLGLETGADDYITKPFSTKELIARVKAVLRRYSTSDESEIIEVNGLKLDPETYRVTADDTIIDISPTEFKLLHFFILHPERVYSRSQLLDQVWGENVYVEERTVDVHIRRLRKTLEPYGFDKFIQTVRSVGYRFSAK